MFNLGNKLAKLKERLLRPNKTGGHKTQPTSTWGTQPRQLPMLTSYMIERMLWDPTIILGLALRNAPVADAELAYKDGDEYVYGVKADNEEVGKFVIEQIERFWARDLHKVLFAQVHGWMGAEVVYRFKDGEVEYDGLLEKHAMDTRALESDGQFWGVKFLNTGHTEPPMLPAGESFWHGFRSQYGQHYGTTIMKGAYPAWCDKNLDGGAMDVRKLYMHKYAYGGAVMGYPKGSTEISEGVVIPNGDLARQMVEQEKTGAVLTKPNIYDENGKELWTFEWRDTGAVPTHIFDYPKDLDREELRGLEVPDEIIMSGGAGSWEGKKVPLTAFYTQQNIWGSSILTDFDRQVLRNLVLLRFGKAYDFDAQLKPFSVQLAENENEGDGKSEGSLGGDVGEGIGARWSMSQQQRQAGRIPPQMPQPAQRTQQPVAMSLDHAAELHAAEVVGQAERIVEIAQRAIERQALSLDASGHEHKGKGPGGGQFVKGGGGGSGEKSKKKEPKNSKVSEWASKKFKNPVHAKAFTEWFGDSKVVDENGEPLVVYHGATQSFSSFLPNAFFSDNPEVAGDFATSRAKNAGEDDPSQRTIATYINLKSPLIIDAKGMHAGEIQFANMDRYGYRKGIADKKFDGVIITNTKDEGNLYVVKNPNQIKSATGNAGTFDPSNPSIKMGLK